VTGLLKWNAWNGQIRVNRSVVRDIALISVEDTGIGIAAPALPHVFDLLVQADPQRKIRIAVMGWDCGSRDP
jgi:signal transduction histidine kinase